MQATSVGELLNAGIEHAGEESVLESLVEVAHRPQLGLDPALLYAVLKRFQPLEREIVFHHAVEGSFRRQHPALDREMNALQPLRIQEAGGVAKDHPAVARDWRNAPPAAIWQGLRAVANHLPAFQQFGDEWVLFEFLQHALGIEARITIVESGDETK